MGVIGDMAMNSALNDERKRLRSLCKANNDLARMNLARAEKAEARAARLADAIEAIIEAIQDQDEAEAYAIARTALASQDGRE